MSKLIAQRSAVRSIAWLDDWRGCSLCVNEVILLGCSAAERLRIECAFDFQVSRGWRNMARDAITGMLLAEKDRFPVAELKRLAVGCDSRIRSVAN